MVGIIQQLFFEFVNKNFGDEAVDEVRRRAGIPEEQEFRADTSYPEDEWQRIVRSAVELSGLSADDAELAFADYCGEQLSVRMAGFFQACATARQFLSQQPKIHNSMASSLRDPVSRRQVSDKFHIEEKDDETITHYVSPNQLCTFFQGLARWVANYYKEEIRIDEPKCMKRGDSECELHIKYLGPCK